MRDLFTLMDAVFFCRQMLCAPAHALFRAAPFYAMRAAIRCFDDIRELRY